MGIVKRLIILCAAASLFPGCSSNRPTEVVTVAYTPHLWSDHKMLSIDIDSCATKGEAILQSLGFSQIVRNGAYIYGNFSNNRAAIKCVRTPQGSFVYAAVAGPNVKLVEKLRNEIVWQL